jgi:hypothetical protein
MRFVSIFAIIARVVTDRPEIAFDRRRLILGPSGTYHADALDGDCIIATPVSIEWIEGDDLRLAITASGPQVALPADDGRVLPYEGPGTAAEVLSR